ncbi:hypothetical protein DV735_g2663, partial [Chaetothyriales sp. CBS 134920]
MKRLRLQRWSGTVLSPRTRPSTLVPPSTLGQSSLGQSSLQAASQFSTSSCLASFDSPVHACATSGPLPFGRSWKKSLASASTCKRCLATTSTPLDPPDHVTASTPHAAPVYSEATLLRLPSPPASAARSSAKLSALHARLQLPSALPVETLARTLVDASADPSPQFNNKSLAVLGSDLLSYYTSEYIIAQYPRLPLAVVFAAMYAYVGPKALASITREWGVEYAAHPGGEVDPGLLQFRRLPPAPLAEKEEDKVVKTSFDDRNNWRRGMSSRAIYSDEFGDVKQAADLAEQPIGVTAEKACTHFVRALMGAIYVHAGRAAVKQFYHDHFMSRQLNMASLFQFRHPTKDLSRLCAREGFQSPIARIISETGRRSRHPVFIVGVYSGNDKLGEGAGASLDEARTRAAVAALKGWYLYSPLPLRLPSEMEEPGAKDWSPIIVDTGDIVV